MWWDAITIVPQKLTKFDSIWDLYRNTFLTPWSEMALTLQDVLYITRLPIWGIRAEMENGGKGMIGSRANKGYLLGDDRDHSSTWKSGAGMIYSRFL